MLTVLLLLSVVICSSNLEPQIGYWICDAIKQEKNVDLVVLPNLYFSSDISDTLIITHITKNDLNYILTKNSTPSCLLPIAGFIVCIDSFNNHNCLFDILKPKYSIVTTTSLFNNTEKVYINENIADIFKSYLNKSANLNFPKTNRYQFISSTNDTQVANSKLSSLDKNNKININTADQVELERLPGIGPKIAQKIIEYRNQHGFFENINEIIEVKGIGLKKFKAIKDLITTQKVKALQQ